MPDPIAMKTAFDTLKPTPLTDDKGEAIGFALTGPQVTDENILIIQPALNQMKRISFTNAAITNGTFKALGKLSNLEELDFASTKVTAEDLSELSALPQLAKLEFVSTGLTDSALKVLPTFNHLKELKIAKEDVCDASVDELKKALPNCKVDVTK
jgi:Leucine-rich repeat (LRR) protein